MLCCFLRLVPVSLDCPMLIDPSVFSNVYLNHVHYNILVKLWQDCLQDCFTFILTNPSLYDHITLSTVYIYIREKNVVELVVFDH